jgi:hypothetical protein
MAKFRVFNVQLLPNEDGINEVGRSGYRKLFSELKKLNGDYLKASTHTTFHYKVAADTFIGPYDFNFPSGYVYGHFVRYSKASEITELRTGKTLYRAPRSGKEVSGIVKVPYVFDTTRHLLAIDGAALPKSESFVDALIRFLTPVQEASFPNHELTVNLVSRANAIEQVFQTALSYKVVELNLSFRNGPASDALLAELKESKTHQVKVCASAGPKGRMSKVPEFIKDLLRAASSLGWSRISYFVQQPDADKGVVKKAVFDSREAPLTLVARHSSSDTSEAEFFERVSEKLEELDLNQSDGDALLVEDLSEAE